MADLRQGRLIRIRFARPEQLPAGVPTALPGLLVRDREREKMTLEYTGPLAPLLEWLAGLPLEDLQMEPLGLSRIYHRFHGAEV
jgi:ABC-2 type transport system ATP-binding protein